MKIITIKFLIAGMVAALIVPAHTLAQDINPDTIPESPRIYSPYVERTTNDANLVEGVYWGDTHLHTNYSTDSGMLGNTLGPEEAYRFARVLPSMPESVE